MDVRSFEVKDMFVDYILGKFDLNKSYILGSIFCKKGFTASEAKHKVQQEYYKLINRVKKIKGYKPKYIKIKRSDFDVEPLIFE